MKKRILSIVLAVLMLVSVLPISALAADGSGIEAPAETTPVSGVSANSEDNAVHVTKSVSKDGKTLTLEAYATNSISTHTSYEPLDIVLVLDVSGSMDDTITSYTYKETAKDRWSCNDIYDTWETYYYKDDAGNYQQVWYGSEGGGLFSSKPYRCWITAGGKQIGSKVSGWYDVSYHGKLYTRQNAGEVDKIVALKTAVNTFIDSVAKQKDSKGNAIANRISLVKFAGTKIDWTGNNEGNATYKDGRYTYNNSQVVKGLTDASTGKNALKTAVNSLTAAGATSADFGMELAKAVLDGRTDKTRKSVVIMFTDGEPNHDNGFASKVASDAIAAAKTLKGGGTLVYTIGMFTGANPSSTADAINKYMHAVSSNYPNATYTYTSGWNSGWNWNLGARAEGNYYLAASNAGALDDVFQAISQDIGTLTAKIDDSSVLSDTLSGAFDFNAPENAEYSGITVAKYPVTGMENGVYTWGAAQELAIGEGEGKVQVKVTGKKLEVTGFDYGANAVTTKTEGETTTYSGYKLVVTIPIKPDMEYHGWADGKHYYDTNSTAEGTRAGLTYGETGSRQTLELNDSPNAPVTAYTVSYKHQGEKPSTANDFKDERYYIAGQEATVKAAPTSPVTEGDFTYTFGGWTSDEIKDGKISITDHNVTVTGNWTKTASTTTVGVTKNWNFLSDGKTHTAVVKLYADGVEVNGYTFKRVYIEGNSLTLSEKATRYFKDLPIKNDLGEKIVYTAKEISIDGIPVPVAEEGENTVYVTAESASAAEGGYATKVWKITTDGLVITNVLEDATKHTVSYEFKGETPEGATAPVSKSYFVGQKYALESVTGVDDWTFEGWYDSYDETNGFGSKVTGEQTMGSSDVTYYGKWTKEEQPPETISITVKKSWDTNDSESVVTPNEISVQLTQNGEDYGDPVQLSAANNWMHIFNNLPKVDGEGNPYTYSVKELSDLEAKDADGNVIGTWKPSIVPTDGKITITNTFEEAEQPEETIDITVKKSWENETYNEDLKLPESVDVALLRNNKIIDTTTLHWRTENYGHTFKDLPKYDADDSEYVYTVKEQGDKIARNKAGERIGTWKDTYEKTAEGWDIKNTFKADETPELEDHEFTAHIVKRFENKSGKSPKATFTFVAALDDGTKVGRATISFSKGEVDAGDFKRKDETMTVKLTDNQYKALEKDRIGRYLWIYEEDGEVDGVKYDTEPKKAYIYEKPVAWSLEFDEDGGLVFSVPDENTLYCLVGDEMVEDFVFTNTYKKSGKVEKPVKVGPQLNRDDHVAYIMGYPDGTVQPEGQITRAEACTIFFRLLTDSSRDYYFARTNDYSDVNRGDWFNNAISTLSNAGIVTGYNDGTFRPNQPITRGEMAKIIANFANLNKGTKSFTDLSGHWSKSYVELAAGNGWIAGYPDGSFRPDQKITRAETVTMINRVLERVPAKELRLLSRSIMLTFPDNNPGDWYYIAIQEASNSHEYQRSVYETAGDEMWTKLIDNVDWTKLEK